MALAWLSERGHSHIHRGQRIEEASLERLDLTKQLMATAGAGPECATRFCALAAGLGKRRVRSRVGRYDGAGALFDHAHVGALATLLR